MIFIDISRLAVSPEWKELARHATSELQALPEHAGPRFFETHSHIWRQLKSAMEELSHQKCWYCEGRTSRFDFHVDHYRPKNRVTNRDGTQEPGYPWLAFDHKNFRLACGYCDSAHTGPDNTTRGKVDQFPLATGSLRASFPDSNLHDEVPLLLDPTRPSDPLLLWFLDDGMACPSCPTGLPYVRAKETIAILNLNYYKTCEDRKRIWVRCTRLVEQGNRAFAQYERGSPAAIEEFEFVIREIRDLISASAEFSATARACIRGIAYPWVTAFE